MTNSKPKRKTLEYYNVNLLKLKVRGEIEINVIQGYAKKVMI